MDNCNVHISCIAFENGKLIIDEMPNLNEILLFKK